MLTRLSINGPFRYSGRHLAVLLAAVYGVLFAFGQPASTQQPQALSISGVVVDSSSNPLKDVEIYLARGGSPRADGSIRRYDIVRTEELGKFAFRTVAPFVVVRKAGFESQRLYTGNLRGEVVVKLEPARRTISSCSSTANCASLPSGVFCFPAVANIAAAKPFSNTDSTSRDFVSVLNPKSFVMHDCCGPGSTDGLPNLAMVWRSDEYKETVYQVANIAILDARGTRSGKAWRYVARLGEFASYSGSDSQTAADLALMDELLDGVCVLPQPR